MAEDHLPALVPVNHSLASGRTVTHEELHRVPFIMTEAGSARLIEPLLGAEGLALEPRYRMAQIITILRWLNAVREHRLLPSQLYLKIRLTPIPALQKSRYGLRSNGASD